MSIVRQRDDDLGLLQVMHQDNSNRDLPLELPGVTDQLLPTMAGIILSLSRSISLSLSLFHRSLALSLCPALSGKSADIVRRLDYIGL
mgnify:CR=1 FL=1